MKSFQPLDKKLGEVDSGVKTNLRAVEEEIEEQLRMANETSLVEQIDLQALAPKKVSTCFSSGCGNFSVRTVIFNHELSVAG